MTQKSRLGRMTKWQWGSDKRWNWFYPIKDGWDYEPTRDQSVSSIAQATGQKRLEVAYDHMLTRAGTGTLWQGSPDVVGWYNTTRERLAHPRVVPGISDAGAHLAIFQDGTTPTSMISFWGRDRKQGTGTLPLELCVQKQSRDTAYLYGLTDCGTIEVGKKADLNLVNMATLKIHDPVVVNDLPAGAPRWSQVVSGYEMTVCSGTVTFEMGRHTGAFPGRVAKNPNRGRARSGLPDPPAEFSGYRLAKLGKGDATTEESMLQTSMEAESGISNASRVSKALDEETSKAKL